MSANCRTDTWAFHIWAIWAIQLRYFKTIKKIIFECFRFVVGIELTFIFFTALLELFCKKRIWDNGKFNLVLIIWTICFDLHCQTDVCLVKRFHQTEVSIFQVFSALNKKSQTAHTLLVKLSHKKKHFFHHKESVLQKWFQFCKTFSYTFTNGTVGTHVLKVTREHTTKYRGDYTVWIHLFTVQPQQRGDNASAKGATKYISFGNTSAHVRDANQKFHRTFWSIKHSKNTAGRNKRP